MISGLNGHIARFGASSIYLNVAGVEYEVHLPLNVFDHLQKTNSVDEIHLFVYHHFMQDEQRLYGFLAVSQRELFIALKNLKGLGTGLALSILSHLDGATLLYLCETKDVKALTKIPRIGKNTAETIVFEINRRGDRLRKIIQNTSGNFQDGSELNAADTEYELAVQALLKLGYKDSEARTVLQKMNADQGKDYNASDLIRKALRAL